MCGPVIYACWIMLWISSALIKQYFIKQTLAWTTKYQRNKNIDVDDYIVNTNNCFCNNTTTIINNNDDDKNNNNKII